MVSKIENPNIETEKLEQSEFEKEKARKLSRLRDVLNNVLKDPNGGTYAYSGEKGFSGDAASLYTLIETQNENGEMNPELIKIGWGEFSKETFTSSKYPQFQNLPFDIYCVPQYDSFLVDDKLSDQMKNNPIDYLKEKSVLAVSKDGVEIGSRDRESKIEREVAPLSYDQILKDTRNLAIDRGSDREEFSDFLKQLPDDPSKVWEFIQANKDNRNVRILYRLGINPVGAGVGDIEAMKSFVEIKNDFDFKNKCF